jgi:N utilization substance protein B
MLSRRSVRIKAMQLLFAVNRDKELSSEDAKERFWSSIDDTFNLYLLNLAVMVNITRIAQKDLENRKKKHLPNDLDKIFKDKIYNNTLVKNLDLNAEFKKALGPLNIEQIIQSEYYDSMYNEFAKTQAYIDYITKESSADDHLEILLELYRFCRQNELFNEIMEGYISTWVDDKSVVVGAVKKTLKALPQEKDDFFYQYKSTDETVKDFGYNLFSKTLENDEALLAQIEPTLKNWESDRIAVIDMILMKMALSEMIGFSTIPVKVTINEYVEIAKNYSTAKSKEFINGVLDKIMKELEESGSLNKVDRNKDS